MAELCVALDCNINLVLDIVTKTKHLGLIYKFGYEVIFTPYFYHLCRFLQESKLKLFVDAKLNGTPDTIYSSVCRLSEIELNYLTLTATQPILSAARLAKVDCGASTKLIAVDALSSDADPSIIYKYPKSDFDGVVCGGKWISQYKAVLPNHLIITPGIRFDSDRDNHFDSDKDNHSYVLTPKQAVDAGSDIIVVGRPIYKASNPVQIVEDILREIA